MKIQKTREIVTVPLRAEALVIVEQLLAGEVRPITNQKLNDCLKELGQLASIDGPVEVVRFRGGVRAHYRSQAGAAGLPYWLAHLCHTEPRARPAARNHYEGDGPPRLEVLSASC